MVANSVDGILLWGDAAPEIHNNLIRQNGDTGIAYFERSAGRARDNELLANGKYGIYVDQEATPNLVANRLQDNAEAGLAYFGNAAGTAENNQCLGPFDSIYVGENAGPRLWENACPVEGLVAVEPKPQLIGREIVYSAWRDGNEDIYAMYADGTAVVRLTQDPARDYMPRWSPDATKIVFVSERAADGDLSNPEIYVMNADGGEPRRLTDNAGKDWYPAWSPDGAQIAYAAEKATGEWGTFVVDAGGGEPRLISPDGMAGTSPSWSPDGDRLVVSLSSTDTPLLAILKLGTREIVSLARKGDQGYWPDWSPVGEQIAFVSDAGPEVNGVGPGIHIIEASGLNLVRVLYRQDMGTVSTPTWSPDGTQIAFVAAPDGHGSIWRMNADGTGLTRVSKGTDPCSFADWSPVAPEVRQPRFNAGGHPWCFNTPDQGAPGDWQVTARRDQILPGERIEITLRNRAAGAASEVPITARIVAPDETESKAAAMVIGDERLTLAYPPDFRGAKSQERGAYTIIWEQGGEFVACDGFVVGGGVDP
jgi:parallel beta-helix repeat protein